MAVEEVEVKERERKQYSYQANISSAYLQSGSR